MCSRLPLLCLPIALLCLALPASALRTTRVSVDSAGAETGGGSRWPAMTPDARFVAFESAAVDVAPPAETQTTADVFIRDRYTGQTSRVSVNDAGSIGDSHSQHPSVSENGGFVAFESSATNLVDGDTNGKFDVFVRDRQGGTTTRVSVTSAGAQASGDSTSAAISADGRYVAFASTSPDLTADDTNGVADIFVHDLQSGVTTRVSVDSSGAQADGPCSAPGISASGQLVVFSSLATNLVTGDTNGFQDVFVHDCQTGLTTRVSVASSGAQADLLSGEWPSTFSADGRYVAFDSVAGNLVADDTNLVRDAFVHDRQTGQTTRVSLGSGGVQGNGNAEQVSISADAGHVAYSSWADNLLTGDTNGTRDVFRRDLQTGETSRASVATDGSQAEVASTGPRISADGRHIAFSTHASNLVPDDTNGGDDVFLRDTADVQPDLLIHDGTAFIGEGTHNTDGTGQVAAQAAVAGSPATYATKLRNAGSAHELFRLSGPGGDADWQVRYLLHAEATDITADIAGPGYVTEPMAPGGEVAVDVEVTPLSGADVFELRSVLLTATAIYDGGKVDAVRADTTRAPEYQPDGLIYNGTAYIGSGVYNVDGAGQTHAISVLGGSTAVYHVRLQNDGSVSDVLRLTGPTGNASWDVKYVDHATGTDITGDVTGAGWVTASLAPGAYHRVRLEVTPAVGVAEGAPRSVRMVVSSTCDTDQKDAVKAETTCAATCLPDGLIYDGSSYVGDGIYNATGEGQTHAQSVVTGVAAIHHVRLYNDGNTATSLVVTGPAGSASFDVHYFDHVTGVDITAGVTGTGWATPAIAPGAYHRLRIEVTPLMAATPGAVFAAAVTATAAANGAGSDTVLAQTALLPGCVPDGLIYDGAGYLGDGIFNATGTGQSHAQSVQSGAAATYHVRLQNDGSVAGGLLVTGPAGTGLFAVRYLDHATETDITGEVTTAGWRTPVLGPGAYHRVRVEVTPLSAAPGTVFAAAVTATSGTDPSRIDTVLTGTTALATYRPDGLIHNGSAYVGDGIYNTNGAGQTHASTVGLGDTAVYHVRFYNDGNADDSFVVAGLQGNARWAITYLDYGTGDDISGLVTGAGWTTPSLAPGEYWRAMVRVSPRPNAPANALASWTLTASSSRDATGRDAVKVITHCAPTCMPDGAIHSGTTYVGEGVYSTNGTGQTVSSGVSSNSTSTYAIYFRNSGNGPGSLVISGPAGNASWAVTYTDVTTGADITSAIAGAGWTTPSLNAGGHRQLSLSVSPVSELPAREVFDALVLGAAAADASQRDAVRAVTTCAGSGRPDGQVQTPAGFVGDGIFNATGVDQTHEQSVEATTATYNIRFCNDGTAPDTFRVRLSSGSLPWQVACYDAATGAEITWAVWSQAWVTSTVRPGRYQGLRLEVTPPVNVAPGSVQSLLVTATSETDAALSDAVKCETTCLRTCRPDAQIRDGTAYLGDGVYNTTGAGQSHGLSAGPGTVATYTMQFVNDGNEDDRFTITGTAGTSFWQVMYLDATTSADITDEVTGGGSITPALAPRRLWRHAGSGGYGSR